MIVEASAEAVVTIASCTWQPQIWGSDAGHRMSGQDRWPSFGTTLWTTVGVKVIPNDTQKLAKSGMPRSCTSHFQDTTTTRAARPPFACMSLWPDLLLIVVCGTQELPPLMSRRLYWRLGRMKIRVYLLPHWDRAEMVKPVVS